MTHTDNLATEFPLLPNFSLTPDQIADKAKEARRALNKQIQAIVRQPDGQKDFSRVIVELDHALAEFANATLFCELYSMVATEEETQKAASQAEALNKKHLVDIFSRRDLASTLKQLSPSEKEDERRLYAILFQCFEESGATLPEPQRTEYVHLLKRVKEIESVFSFNIAKDATALEVKEEELAGLPPDFVSKIERQEDGTYLIGTRTPVVAEFLKWAGRASVRKSLSTLYHNRASERNVSLFKEAIHLRHQLAAIRGDVRRPKHLPESEPVTHADYVLENKLAESKSTVFEFLNQILERLRPTLGQEYKTLLSLKREDAEKRADALTKEEQPAFRQDRSLSLYTWDISYYKRLLKERELKIDLDRVKDYFPMEHVVKSTLKIYEEIFGLRFQEVDVKSNPSLVWHHQVKLYEVWDAATSKRLAFFYTDLLPRPNKYQHYAAFSVVQGGWDREGKRRLPATAIVGNFKEQNDISDVETFFHEFGHIMHNSLTQARFYNLAGYNVLPDFVEVPSQIMENWVWDEKGLQRLACKPLPEDLLNAALKSKAIDQSAYYYTRQIFFSLIDLVFHGEVPTNDFDPMEKWATLFKEVVQLDFLEGTQPVASFDHLMGGYDAGFYGYLWSKKYAQDLFTRFQNDGLYNSETGKEYRRLILEPGDSTHPDQLVETFLGRPLRTDALLKSIGLT